MFVDLECKAHKLLLPGQMLQRNVGASLVYHLTVQDFLFLRHFPLWVQKILAAAHTCHIFQQIPGVQIPLCDPGILKNLSSLF